MLGTSNGGTTWPSKTSGSNDLLDGVSFADANNRTDAGRCGTIPRTRSDGVSFVE